MLRRVIRVILLMVLLMVFITACSRDTVNLDAGKFGVKYTNSLQRKSEFAVFDEKGKNSRRSSWSLRESF